MDNIPNLSYDSSGQFSGRQTEPKLIAIESDDEPSQFDLLHEDKQLHHDSQAFQRELERLKAQSTRKFQSKWEQILQKYSTIEDEKASDEIDLVTGRITIDNGHLRSLNTQLAHDKNSLDGNIWAVDYDWERDKRLKQKKQKDQKHQLKSRLKLLNLFYNSLSTESIDEPTHKRAPLEDNLLLNPSPTKKSRLSSSPVRADARFDVSPTKAAPVGSDSDTSPIKQNGKGASQNSDILPTRLFDLSGNFDSPTEGSSFDLSHSSSISEHPKSKKSLKCALDQFEEEYSILTEYLVDNSPQVKIFECAIENCYYCTGNKSLYQNHLLEKHSGVLYTLGYPVSLNENETPLSVSEKVSKKLHDQFPIMYPIPPLALSGTGEPFHCMRKMQNGKLCQKFFLSMGDLRKHQMDSLSDCSCKKQVLVCPLLGCGYMTDGGYLEWRTHFIDLGHDINPKQVVNQAQESSSIEKKFFDRYNINQELIRRPLDINDNINELFSDSSGIESDLEDSELLEEELHSEKEDPFDFPKIDHNSILNSKPESLYVDDSSYTRMNPQIEPRKISIQGVPDLSKSPVDYKIDVDAQGYESIEELFQG
ncbi:uncharacterized protein CANTADRAFT_110899 [Suhomyces tanzawaensis NRRL Y-17324]|uniref:Uncharacterized protein n=1 Tax=Suhomyces tanzawaensis NRRL Y-17324 TaxID=984487 RepID=A0A1E4SPU6_9ASCO|nr:uncharacterized protein CANTADRAFT_110899 [Suhomyces tanzawaensis NRRL Y-17324]ODV81526.1 hypothetical protein CANTADRAFT_110899 [Suhomyces tanzawaensis NRRL Y-17324]